MLAEAYPDEPEKVQLVALLARAASGAAVIAGSATGEAAATAAKASTREEVREIMVKTGMNVLL